MPRAIECERCQLFSGYCGAEYLVCGIHPGGPTVRPCPDYAPVVEERVPVGAEYYGEELVKDWPGYMSSADRLHLIETHPLFTGRCPQCGTIFQETPPVHWDCPDPKCHWMDDTIV
jgi:hypothetical protein